MDKLEQVSENPDLKEEMEREVTSTNSQVLTQAASWASWAVGAIGAKFYKSANKPPENATKDSGSTAQTKLPENSEKQQNSVKPQTVPSSKGMMNLNILNTLFIL